MAQPERRQLAPVVRAAFIKAIYDIEEGRQAHIPKNLAGKTFSHLLVEAIGELGILTVMDKIAKYVERDAKLEINTPNDWIDSLRRIGNTASNGEVEDKPDALRH